MHRRLTLRQQRIRQADKAAEPLLFQFQRIGAGLVPLDARG
jgi:hypothetical protein